MRTVQFNKTGRRLVAATALSVACLAALVASPASASSSHHSLIAGVGDSYISGQGVPPFVDGTDTATDQCHRSASAFPNVIGKQLHEAVRNVACSGATTADLFTPYKSESPQSSRIGDATDVLVTIGGNDINALGAISSPPTPQQFAAELQTLGPKLVATYQRLQTAAPKAHITATGYPSIFNTNAIPACPVSQQQRTFLVQATQALNTTIASAATAAHVGYVDVTNAFAGHELCTAQPWVNGVDTVHPVYSLHPNAAGQAALAELVKPAVHHKHHCWFHF